MLHLVYVCIKQRKLQLWFCFFFQNVSRDLCKLIRSAGFADVSMETLLRYRPSKKSQSTSMGPGNVLNISQTDSSSSISAVHLSPALVAVLKAVLTAGLYPNIARVISRPTVESAAMGVQETCVAQTQYGLVHAHPSSVNRYLAGPGWLIFHEKVGWHTKKEPSCGCVTL